MFKIGTISVDSAFLNYTVIGSDNHFIELFNKFMDILKVICGNYDVTYIYELDQVIIVENYDYLPEKVKDTVMRLRSVSDDILEYISKVGDYRYSKSSKIRKCDAVSFIVDTHAACAVIILDIEMSKLIFDYWHVNSSLDIIVKLSKERYNIINNNITHFGLFELMDDME